MIESGKKYAVILHNPLTEDSKEDELDVLVQADLIEKTLPYLGYLSDRMEFSLNTSDLIKIVKEKDPDIIFNLVETVNNTGKFSFVVPAILDAIGLKYSGSGTEAIYTTTDKIICKTILQKNNLETPHYAKELYQIIPEKIYIIKPVAEDGSVGIDDNQLYYGHQLKNIPVNCFAEEYIDGREFNISIIGGDKGVTVLPPAEMCFHNYPEGKPKILGYNAKWEESAFEYKNTARSFIFDEQDNPILEKLKSNALKCWNCFKLKGYARVDFRVGKDNIPRIIEINANPCLSPESGFIAACTKAGLSVSEVIKNIIEDAKRN